MIQRLVILLNLLVSSMIKKQLKALKRENYSFVEDAGRGYRRVVPSPQPKSIVELASIKTLIENDVL